jgi:hypothetical protein
MRHIVVPTLAAVQPVAAQGRSVADQDVVDPTLQHNTWGTDTLTREMPLECISCLRL